jgi:hypothetical protein
MPKKITRKGAFMLFIIFNILSGKQTVNGAFEIIDVSRVCLLIALRNMSGKLPDSTAFSVRE